MTMIIYLLIKFTIKLMWATAVVGLWLCWACIALPGGMIATIMGKEQSASGWFKTLDWSHAFRHLL